MNNQPIISMLQDYRSLVSEMIHLKIQLVPQQKLNCMRVQMLSEIEVLRETHTQINDSIHQLIKNGQKTL